MPIRPNPYRWWIFGSLPVVVTGMALVMQNDQGPWRTVGVVAFVAGSVVYVAARIAGVVAGRR